MEYRKAYEQFLSHVKDPASLEELMSIQNDEKEIEDRFYRFLEFGTAGMRGHIAMGTNRMNIYTVRRSTKGLADYLNANGKAQQGVAIAYDTRKYSFEFALETSLVLNQNGIKTYLYKTPHSVPQLSFTILQLQCAGGVVITASHNPKEYNGYKVYGEDGGQLAPDDADKIMSYINQIDDLFSIEKMEEKDAIEAGLLNYIGEEIDEQYFAKVLELAHLPYNNIPIPSDFSVVYTPLHGTGIHSVPVILSRMGIENLHIVKEQENADPNFSTVSAPNPEQPDALDLAKTLANKTNANLILATDPDCDRLGVAARDTDGSFVSFTGNEIGLIIIDYMLTQMQNTHTLKDDSFMVKSLVSTDLANVICKSFGVTMIDVLTGFKFIAEQIKLSKQTGKGTFIFGFEESFGYLSGTFVRDKDAAIASMLVVKAAAYHASQNKTLADALRDIFAKYSYCFDKTLSKTFAGIDGAEKIASILDQLKAAPPKSFGKFQVTAFRDYNIGLRTDFISGTQEKIDMPASNVLYFEMENAKLIVRPSGTEPKVKVYIGAMSKDREVAKANMDELMYIAEELLQ